MSRRIARAFLIELAGISIWEFFPKKFFSVADIYIFTFSSVRWSPQKKFSEVP
jgi:hypothetical protein